MQDKLQEYRGDGDIWQAFSLLALKMKAIHPERDFKISGNDIMGMQKEMDNARDQNIWSLFSWQAIAMKILDPKHEFSLEQGDQLSIKNSLEESHSKEEKFMDFISLASNVKILDSNFNIGLTDGDWQNMKENLESFRKEGKWKDFTALASQMKILAAKKVGITDRGFEIEM